METVYKDVQEFYKKKVTDAISKDLLMQFKDDQNQTIQLLPGELEHHVKQTRK